MRLRAPPTYLRSSCLIPRACRKKIPTMRIERDSRSTALPLYTEQDANRALKQVRPVGYGEELQLGKLLSARFYPAGHILGSSFIRFVVSDPGRDPFTIVFSGDLGRYDEPILNDPSSI